jgi:hypothetical protein
MYRNCIFCSAGLGANDALEEFPVGRSVAFDAWKGRLWAICRACGRWNLAPIEERWEAVESAEKLFRDSRVRVQSENIGLTKARDGTRLIRVGQALPGEVAMLRYGGELIRRRRAHYLGIGAAVAAGGVTVVAGLPLIAAAGIPVTLFSSSAQLLGALAQRRARLKVVHRLGAAESPTGKPLTIRREHLYDASLEHSESDGGLLLRLPPTVLTGRKLDDWTPDEMVTVSGYAAQRTVARAITDYNVYGATKADVEQALGRLTAAADTDAFLRSATSQAVALTRPDTPRTQRRRKSKFTFYTPRQILGTFRGEILPVNRMPALTLNDGRRRLQPIDALALEMALHESSERAALEGELAALEDAWREAEEIAAIADALPYDLSAQIARLRG